MCPGGLRRIPHGATSLSSHVLSPAGLFCLWPRRVKDSKIIADRGGLRPIPSSQVYWIGVKS